MSGPVPPLPPGFLAALASGQGTGQVAGQNATVVQLPPGTTSLPVGQTLTGTVVGTGSTAGQLVVQTPLGHLTLQAPIPLNPGTAVTVQVRTPGPDAQVLLQAGGSSARATPSSAPHSGQAVPALVRGAILPTTLTQPAPALPPGSGLGTGAQLALQVVGLASGGAAGTGGGGNASAALAGQGFTATVSGTNPAGQTLLQTPLGEMAVSLRPPPAAGSSLQLQIASPLKPGAAPVAQQWDALRGVLASLQQSDPAGARALIQHALPQVGQNMTGGMLFFLSAMMAGDIRRLIGEEGLRALERMGGGAADRLGDEVGAMRRAGGEPGPADWRSFLIPLLTDEGLANLRLFTRDGRPDPDDPAADPGRRMVVEVELLRIGRFQLDTLTRDNAIRVLIRTESPLPEDWRDGIRATFGNIVSALGKTGEVTFHAQPNFPLKPLEEIAAGSAAVTV